MLRAWNVRAEEGFEREVREAVVRVCQIEVSRATGTAFVCECE